MMVGRIEAGGTDMVGNISEGGQMIGLPENLVVLVVEPQKFQSDLLRNALLAAGVDGEKVVAARDVTAAIEILKNTVPDVVLTELDFPDAPGEHLVRHLRSQKISAPVLAVTSQGESTRVQAAVAAGINDYLLKPVSNALVVQRILRHLKKAGWTNLNGGTTQRTG